MKFVACYLGLSALFAITHGQAIVYDNTQTFTHRKAHLLLDQKKVSAEVGDEVQLAGTARNVVEIRIRFWYDGQEPGTFDCRLRFRNLSKTVKRPGPPTRDAAGHVTGAKMTPAPGDVFYDSGFVKAMKIEPGMNEYKFEIPKIKVPGRFVWTVAAINPKGTHGNLGPAYYDPPTVGSSEDFMWQQEVGAEAWIAYGWGGDPVANFGCRILATEGKSAGR